MPEEIALARRRKRQPDYDLAYHREVMLPAQKRILDACRAEGQSVIDGMRPGDEVFFEARRLIREKWEAFLKENEKKSGLTRRIFRLCSGGISRKVGAPMWRLGTPEPPRQPKETVSLDEAMRRIRKDASLRARADKAIGDLKASEPLFADLCRCPQTPVYHAEGPFVADHVRLILMSLYAIADGAVHLLDIEELRRLKGYEGEIEELEETIREKAASLETYALCHDLGKPETAWFEARPGSEGDALGFNLPLSHAWLDADASQRRNLLETYVRAYEAFAATRSDLEPAEIQTEFFAAYQVTIHHHGHGTAIARPAFRELFGRIAEGRRLPPGDREDVFHVIVRHMDAIGGFSQPGGRTYASLLRYAHTYDRDADDFLDLFLAAVFLDAVCGSARRGAHGVWHDAGVAANFLLAERDQAPEKRAAREKRREATRKKEEQHRLRAVGLDGESLLDLLLMDPGPAFGTVLRAIHATARGEGYLPTLPPEVEHEVESRILRFRRDKKK